MALSYPTRPGDIDHLIADDHAVVERKFQHLEAGRGDRRVLVDQIAFELAAHAFAEETVLYPIWPRVGMNDEHEDAEHEHRRIKELLVALTRHDPGQAAFEGALRELIDLTRHHVDDEEQEELPEFRQKAGAQRMAELGEEFLAAKRGAPTRPHPHAPDEGVAERVAGALAAPLDRLRDEATGRKEVLGTDPSGLLDAQAQALVDAHAELVQSPLSVLTPEQARQQPGLDAAVRRLMARRGLQPSPVAAVDDLRIPDAAGGEQTLRVWTPERVLPNAPIIFWVHGGGWVLFDLDTCDASCRGLADKTGAVVVSPGYRRAPEHPFPAAHDDVLAAFRWVVVNGRQLGGDPLRIAIGGESVGGTMAVATALAVAQAGEVLPSGVVAVYPMTTAEQFGDSMEDSADARPLDRPLLSWMALHAFRGIPEGAVDPRVDLLSLPLATLALLPPTLVVTAQRDPLRSQGQQFAANLKAAGVDVEHEHYDGVMHEFFGAAPLLDQAERAQQAAARHLERAFGPAGT